MSGSEQETVNIHYVDKNLQIHEDFVGLYNPPNTTGEMLSQVVKDALMRMTFDISNL